MININKILKLKYFCIINILLNNTKWEENTKNVKKSNVD